MSKDWDGHLQDGEVDILIFQVSGRGSPILAMSKSVKRTHGNNSATSECSRFLFSPLVSYFSIIIGPTPIGAGTMV